MGGCPKMCIPLGQPEWPKECLFWASCDEIIKVSISRKLYIILHCMIYQNGQKSHLSTIAQYLHQRPKEMC